MTVERVTPRHSGEEAAGQAAVVRAVTAIMGTVVGLTFLFGFGNVLDLALRLGVPVWVAPLVAPAVDLSILGLLLGTRHLVVQGAKLESLRGVRRLLIFASFVTLTLSVADPLIKGHFGKAAFDAVGPLLLIGWSEVGPGLLQALSVSTSGNPVRSGSLDAAEVEGVQPGRDALAGRTPRSDHAEMVQRPASHLLDRAREEDLRHRLEYQRPISAETLRRRLRVGAGRSRQLVAQVRREMQLGIPARADERSDRAYRVEPGTVLETGGTSRSGANRTGDTAATRSKISAGASMLA